MNELPARSKEKFDFVCDVVIETFWSVFPYLSRSTQFSAFGPAEQQKLATVYGIGLTYLFAKEVEPQFFEILPETPNHAAFASLNTFCEPFWAQWDKLDPAADIRRQDPVAVWVVQVLLGAADQGQQNEINALCHFYEVALAYLGKRWRGEPLVEEPKDWLTRERELQARMLNLPPKTEAVSELPEGLYLVKAEEQTLMVAEAKVLAIFQENGVFISGWSHPTIFAAARPDPVMGLPAEFAQPIPVKEARDWAAQYADRLGMDYLAETAQGELTVFLGLTNLRDVGDQAVSGEQRAALVKEVMQRLDDFKLGAKLGSDRAELCKSLEDGSVWFSSAAKRDFPNSSEGATLLAQAYALKDMATGLRPSETLITARPPTLTAGLAEDLVENLDALVKEWSL